MNFTNLLSGDGIRHGISTRDFGSMKKDDNSIDRGNLNRFINYMGISNGAICLDQMHGSNITEIFDTHQLIIKDSDGLVTNKKNITLCVVTADCLPIVFFDKSKKIIGIAHGGRKGLQKGIIKNIINMFKTKYNSNPSEIKVGIGPGIEEKCYEVDGRLMDLRRMAHKKLLDEEIVYTNIEDLDICTKCNNDLFYSYRAGDRSERFATVVSLI